LAVGDIQSDATGVSVAYVDAEAQLKNLLADKLIVSMGGLQTPLGNPVCGV
jgi:hypothetical protein